jgi:asparagine synthase (glutamine-hydrolysing)
MSKLLNCDFQEINIFKYSLNEQDNNKQELLLNSFKTYLTDDILVKVDRATMSVGLEGRMPILDHRIMEFVAQLPYSYKYKDNISKKILRKVIDNYIPEHLMDRKKQGFSIPLDVWIKKDLKQTILETMSRAKKNTSIFKPKYIDSLILSVYKHNGNPYKLWLIFIFQLWYEEWIEVDNSLVK